MEKNTFNKIFGISFLVIMSGLVGYVIGYEDGENSSTLSITEINRMLGYDDTSGLPYPSTPSDEYDEPAKKPELEPSLPSIEIVDISTRATERNNTWHRYAWILVLKNNTDYNIIRDAEFKWLDSDGFVIDTDREYDLSVPANQERTFRGDALISTPGAHSVKSISVNLRY